MPVKLIVFTVLVFLVLGYHKWSLNNSFDQGYATHKSETADDKDEAEESDKKDVETVIKWRIKEKVIFRDKIKKIYIAKDATGCLDTKLIDMGIGLH